MPRERYAIADLTVDVAAASVLRDGGLPIELPQLSFDLLVTLARRAPDVVPAEELIATVWAGVAVSDETLTQRVALLRRALGDDAKSPRYVKAVRGRGYQLVPGVRPLPEAEPLVPAQAPRRRWSVVAAGAAAACVLAVVLVGLARRGESRAISLAPAGAEGSASQGAISTHPPNVPELLSRAGTYLGRHQEADNELAVELYRRALALEPDNADALAGLALALSQRATKFNRSVHEGEDAEALARRAVALEPGLGRAHHALGLALDSQGRASAALAAYRRAAELEPRPALALASAAHLLCVQGRLAEALQTNLEVARAAGDAPVYLEVQVGITLELLGFEQAATVWFERALEFKPDNVFAAAYFAQMRLAQGRTREADALAAAAIARGIRRPELPLLRGVVALLEADGAQARAHFEEARAIDPSDARAEARLLLLARRQPKANTAGADQAAISRRARELAAGLREGRAHGDEWPDLALVEALLEAGFGSEERALAALDDAIRLGYRDHGWLLLDPQLSELRERPAFRQRIETLRGLVEAERQRVLAAPWLPPSFLEGSAARM